MRLSGMHVPVFYLQRFGRTLGSSMIMSVFTKCPLRRMFPFTKLN